MAPLRPYVPISPHTPPTYQEEAKDLYNDPKWSDDSTIQDRFKVTPLSVNYSGTIDTNVIGWLKPSSTSTSLPELRRRLKDDGYVFLKSLLDRDTVLSVREEYFEGFRCTGMLDPDSSAKEGIFDKTKDPKRYTGIGGDVDPSAKLFKLKMVESHTKPKYLKLLEEQKLREMVRNLMGSGLSSNKSNQIRGSI